MPEFYYQVRHSENNLHFIRKIDSSIKIMADPVDFKQLSL